MTQAKATPIRHPFWVPCVVRLVRRLRNSPREIAQALIAAIPESEAVSKVEIAGAGFINVFITKAAKQCVVRGVLQAGAGYGYIHLGAGRKVGVDSFSRTRPGCYMWVMFAARRWGIVCAVCCTRRAGM